MSVFNDAWRYLDLCFIFVLFVLCVRIVLFRVKANEKSKTKAKKGQDTNFNFSRHAKGFVVCLLDIFTVESRFL